MAEDLDKLAKEIEDAIERLRAAASAESAARNETTAAKNRVNELQKQFDKAVAKLRESAPRDTDWARSR